MKVAEVINMISPSKKGMNPNDLSDPNYHIDKLDVTEKKELEDNLINRLTAEPQDYYYIPIIEALAYLKSYKSIPILIDLLSSSNESKVKLIISALIFEINGDTEMIEMGIKYFKELNKKQDAYLTYTLSDCFFYLAKFKNEQTKQLIKEYVLYPDVIVSYNAKRALEM